MTWLYRYSIRNPKRTVVIAVLATLAIAPGVGRLKLRTDGHALVPPDAPEVLYDSSIRETFGTEDPIVVLIESNNAQGVFNVHTLRLVQKLTTAFEQLGRFSIPLEFEKELSRDTVSKGLRAECAHHGLDLSPQATLLVTERDRRWLIGDRGRWYTLKKETDPQEQPALNVYRQSVLSLATERVDRVIPGTLKFRSFLEPFPETPKDLDRIRDDLEAIELYTGTLVSRDGQATAIFVGVPSDVDRTGLYGEIRNLIAAEGETAEDIHVIGAPVAEALLGTHILEDLGVPSAVLGHRMSQHDPAGARWPSTFYELRVLIGRHVGLVPIAIAVMAIVFLVSFRSPVGTLLPLTEVGACLVAVFGLMGWCGVPVYLTIAVLPVILTAVGVADEIHIFSRYTQQLRDKPQHDHVDTVVTTMAEMWRPVTKTSVTTAVGFLSFALSPISPVRVFGVFTAVGIIFCMLWSLTVIPALLALIRPERFAARPHAGPDATPTRRALSFERLGVGVLRGRYVVLGVAVILVAATPLGLRQIVIQDSWIDGFAPGSEFYRATQTFNQQFLGTHILLVCVDTGSSVLTGELAGRDLTHHEVSFPGDLVSDPETLVGQYIQLKRATGTDIDNPPSGRSPPLRKWSSRIEAATRAGDPIVISASRRRGSPRFALRVEDDSVIQYEIKPQRLTTPETLQRIGDLEEFIESRDEYAVGGVIGPAAYVKTTSFMVWARNEDRRRIPDNIQDVRMIWSRYRLARGIEHLRQLLDENFARTLVTVYMRNANFVDTAKLMQDIRDYERTNLKPHGISLEFAGDVAVSQTLIDAIVTTQTRSLLISLIGIFLVTAALGRSLGWGVYCVLPCGFAVLVNFAVMGWIAMPLGVATSMFAGMTLGIGVDYAIHLMERYRLARSQGAALEAAVRDAVAVTGPAIAIDALGVGLGFGILTLSQVPANARLGGLLALSIAGCLAATLLLLPALLRVWPPRESPPAVEHRGDRNPSAAADGPPPLP